MIVAAAWLPVVSAVVGGLAAALATQLFTRRKTAAEIEKIRAETNEIRLRTERAAAEVESAIAEVKYTTSEHRERIIYASASMLDHHDFRVTVRDGAKGELELEDGGVLNIKRGNTDGRYELRLERYAVEGERESIPPDERIAGSRKFRISCEAKSVGGAHTLDFVLRTNGASPRLAQGKSSVERNEWHLFEHYFRVSPGAELRLYLYDIEVEQPHSSVQLRNLVLAERLA
jgi:hypothetical protein